MGKRQHSNKGAKMKRTQWGPFKVTVKSSQATKNLFFDNYQIEIEVKT